MFIYKIIYSLGLTITQNKKYLIAKKKKMLALQKSFDSSKHGQKI